VKRIGSRSARFRASQVASCFALLLGATAANAQEVGVHAAAGAGHAVSAPQSQRFGWGGGATIGLSYGLTRAFAIQAEGGAMGLAESRQTADPTIQTHATGTVFTGMLGLRVHPFGASRVAGLWLDGNGGLAQTGNVSRPAFDAHIGYDIRPGQGRWDIGPFLGYTQILQSDDPLRPEDARIAWLGVHMGLGAPARPPRLDQDRDMVWDDEDACPRVAGIRTIDPRTNGCPRTDRDLDAVYDDEDACPDERGRRTSDPTTNGCPRRDRDKDAVYDDEDACPTIAGIRTSDPHTNGCPKAAPEPVRIAENKLVIMGRIHFDFDRAEVSRDSWDALRDVASFLDAHPEVALVEVEGHADDRGSDEYNLRLSARRAQSVRMLLISFGVDDARLVSHAFGESRPRSEGHEEQSLRENRRVEFNVIKATPENSAHASRAVPGGG
jgi:OOP family OmpA-OmpF porin